MVEDDTLAPLASAPNGCGDRDASAVHTNPNAVFRRVLFALALIAIGLGVFARLDSLDRKVLWRDESFSLLRIAGHSENALYALFDGKIHTSEEMLALQQVTPGNGLRDTLTSLHEEPQRGPLYYLLARLWIGASGNATTAVRGLSVILGFVGIALGFLLGRRLTHNVDGGLVLAALIALSPIEIRFSQQVREYILVADLTLLSALLLLHATARPNAIRWLSYGLCLLAGLYTNVTFACVIAAQGFVTLCIATRGSRRKRALAFGYLLAATGAAALYTPWAYAASQTAGRHSGDLGWAAGGYSLRSTLTKWAFNIGAVYFDSEYAHYKWAFVLLPLLVVSAAALTHAFLRRGDRTSRMLALAITFSTLVPLVALDVVHRSHFSLVARYQIPTWVGLSMLVTLLIAGLPTRSSAAGAGVATFGFLVLAGCVAVFADRPFGEWWDNNDHLSERAVADVIRAGPHPALVVANIANNNAYDTFVLSRYLEPGSQLLLTGDRSVAIPAGYAATYFFTPSRSELARATAQMHLAPHNVSPQPEFPVPELNAGKTAEPDTVAYDNSLWQLRNDKRLSERK